MVSESMAIYLNGDTNKIKALAHNQVGIGVVLTERNNYSLTPSWFVFRRQQLVLNRQ